MCLSNYNYRHYILSHIPYFILPENGCFHTACIPIISQSASLHNPWAFQGGITPVKFVGLFSHP